MRLKKFFVSFLSLLFLVLSVVSFNGNQKMVVTAADTTVTVSTFTSVNDSLDSNVNYTTAKGGGTSAPALNNGVIRLYQNSSGTGGGTITISVTNGYELKIVVIGSSMGTSIAYTLDSDTIKSTTASLAANDTYTASNLNSSSITFYCMGTSSSTRLYVNYLSVTYGAPETKTLSSIAVSGNGTTSYYVGDTFDSTGFVVTATYDDTSTADVTDKVVWSPTTIAEDTVSVMASYTEKEVIKTASVSITVLQRTLESIAVTAQATKYVVGDVVSTSVTITGTYSDESTEDLTTECTFSPDKLTTSGSQEITITHTPSKIQTKLVLNVEPFVPAGGIEDGAQYFITATYSEKEYILKAGSFAAKGSGDFTEEFVDETNYSSSDAWKFVSTGTNDVYTIQTPDGNSSLHFTNTNNGVVCASVSTAEAMKVTNAADGLVNIQGVDTLRYLSLYNSQDWRCYTGTAVQSGTVAIKLYKYEQGLTTNIQARLSFNAEYNLESQEVKYDSVTINNFNTLDYLTLKNVVENTQYNEITVQGGGSILVTNLSNVAKVEVKIYGVVSMTMYNGVDSSSDIITPTSVTSGSNITYTYTFPESSNSFYFENSTETDINIYYIDIYCIDEVPNFSNYTNYKMAFGCTPSEEDINNLGVEFSNLTFGMIALPTERLNTYTSLRNAIKTLGDVDTVVTTLKTANILQGENDFFGFVVDNVPDGTSKVSLLVYAYDTEGNYYYSDEKTVCISDIVNLYLSQLETLGITDPFVIAALNDMQKSFA